jgi:hypothetical protein
MIQHKTAGRQLMRLRFTSLTAMKDNYPKHGRLRHNFKTGASQVFPPGGHVLKKSRRMIALTSQAHDIGVSIL